MRPKLGSGVSVIKLNENTIEFFKTNTREQKRIKVDSDLILNVVNSLDGTKTTEEISSFFNVSIEEVHNLIEYLAKKGLLDHTFPKEDFYKFEEYRRVIYFLSDFVQSHDQHVSIWNKLRNSTVLIVGLGAVGTWVASNLVESGVENLILVDPDIVEISNLHRQYGYKYQDIGKKKTEALKDRLKGYNEDLNVETYNLVLDENMLNIFDLQHIDLIINCADNPNVDLTTLWVGEYGMKRNIPHIVGGGYNMHLSLIGQTVLPGKSACAKCFEMQLKELNTIDSKRVKKLQVKNRKVGSFGPMCSLIASIIGMEAIKILSNCIEPANINRRGEFDIFNMNLKYSNFIRRDDCEWCGKDGKYYNKGCEGK